MTTFEERHEAAHAAILAGENAQLQEWVDSGLAWLLEGHVGRTAMDALRDGALVLPLERHSDYWGNTVPSVRDIADEVGSPGSVANAEAFGDSEVGEWVVHTVQHRHADFIECNCGHLAVTESDFGQHVKHVKRQREAQA